MLIGITSQVTSMGDMGHEDITEGWDVIGGWAYDLWLNDLATEDGYLVETTDTQIADQQDYWDVGARYCLSHEYYYDDEDLYYGFEIPYGSGSGIRVYIWRNNPDYVEGSIEWYQTAQDFFLITRHHVQWGLAVHHINKVVIPFHEVYDDIENQGIGNATQQWFKLGRVSNTTLLLNSTSETDTLQECIENNDGYTLNIGTLWGEQIADSSMWTTLGQLLSMRLPDCHPIINALLAIPFWAAIAIIAFKVIAEIMPF
jgi:hypothetical protein